VGGLSVGELPRLDRGRQPGHARDDGEDGQLSVERLRQVRGDPQGAQ
jgi:hypothetical protein